MQAGQSFASYLGWILFQATPAKNVWPPCPKSQVSAALLCLDHEVHVNTISVKTLHGLGVARHARPALLPLQPPSHKTLLVLVHSDVVQHCGDGIDEMTSIYMTLTDRKIA